MNFRYVKSSCLEPYIRNMCRVSHPAINGRDGNNHRPGSAAVEFALVGPVLVVMLLSMVVYGNWLWMAQSVQSLATEAARASIAGLDEGERIDLVAQFIAEQSDADVALSKDDLSFAVDSDDSVTRVTVSYNNIHNPIMKLAIIIPAPPAIIERTAVVRNGGT